MSQAPDQVRAAAQDARVILDQGCAADAVAPHPPLLDASAVVATLRAVDGHSRELSTIREGCQDRLPAVAGHPRLSVRLCMRVRR